MERGSGFAGGLELGHGEEGVELHAEVGERGRAARLAVDDAQRVLDDRAALAQVAARRAPPDRPT